MNCSFITSYERDNETELDFAQARYYSNQHGRFTSVDPLMGSATVVEPQSWNRYSYTLNNPLNYTDPDGLKSKPVFSDFNDLSEDEQRILNGSKIQVKIKVNGKTVKEEKSGKELYDILAKDGNKKGNKQLANFLNQTAVLASQTFSNGRTAISYVNSVSQIKQDRITASVDSGLKEQIENVSNSKQKDNPEYTGPENSSVAQGIYDVSFRQNTSNGPQQLSFASSLDFKEADIDIDYCQRSEICHSGEVLQNFVTRSKTDPYKVYKLLGRRPAGAIKPNYQIVKK